MSIHNDDRQYGTKEERSEWLQELTSEYRRQEYEDMRIERKRMEEQDDGFIPED